MFPSSFPICDIFLSFLFCCDLVKIFKNVPPSRFASWWDRAIDFWKEYHGGRMFSSSLFLGYMACSLLLVMLILIVWLRWCLWVFSKVELLFFPLPYYILSRRESPSSVHNQEEDNWVPHPEGRTIKNYAHMLKLPQYLISIWRKIFWGCAHI